MVHIFCFCTLAIDLFLYNLFEEYEEQADLLPSLLHLRTWHSLYRSISHHSLSIHSSRAVFASNHSWLQKRWYSSMIFIGRFFELIFSKSDSSRAICLCILDDTLEMKRFLMYAIHMYFTMIYKKSVSQENTKSNATCNYKTT